jgi:hypothetical protein
MMNKSMSQKLHNMSMYDKTLSVSNILTKFDFTAIDEMDPSLQDGSQIIFEKELPFHIRFFSLAI